MKLPKGSKRWLLELIPYVGEHKLVKDLCYSKNPDLKDVSMDNSEKAVIGISGTIRTILLIGGIYDPIAFLYYALNTMVLEVNSLQQYWKEKR